MTWSKIEKTSLSKVSLLQRQRNKIEKTFKCKIEKTFIQKWICYNDMNSREDNEFVRTTTIFLFQFFFCQSRFTFSLQTKLNRFESQKQL